MPEFTFVADDIHRPRTWLDLLPTNGLRTHLPSDKLAEVLAGVGAATDSVGGQFTMPYTTLALAAARRTAT